MATLIEPRDELFLDSSFAIALAAPSDTLHRRAVELAERIEAVPVRMITSSGILMEIGNALAKQRYRAASVQLLDSIRRDPKIEIVSITSDLFLRGFELYRARTDKEWGLVDCISFTIMTERRITKALTADDHFQQCGFLPLLRDPR